MNYTLKNVCTFTVPGRPQGKGRPRFTKQGRTYTPKKTADYEATVRYAFKCRNEAVYYDGIKVLAVYIEAVFLPPKSVTKSVREQMFANKILPTVKPDVDNICKAILDALNGVAYADDKQIVALTCRKMYGEREEVRVSIAEVVT